MNEVQRGTLAVSIVRISEVSASRRFLMHYFYGSFNPFLGACPLFGGWPLLGGSVMEGSTVLVSLPPSDNGGSGRDVLYSHRGSSGRGVCRCVHYLH